MFKIDSYSPNKNASLIGNETNNKILSRLYIELLNKYGNEVDFNSMMILSKKL